MPRKEPLLRIVCLVMFLALLVSCTEPIIVQGSGATAMASTLAAPDTGEAVRGDLNGWGQWTMSSSLGGTFVYLTGQQTAASASSSGFKLFKDSNQWYSNGNSVAFGAIFGGMNTSTSPNMTFNHIQNKYYAFKWNGDDKGVLFQLSSNPVGITDVSQLPAAPGAMID